MDAASPILFLRDLSKLEKDPQTDQLLLAKKLPIDKITVFGTIVDVEETSHGEVTIQLDDSSGITTVLVSRQLRVLRNYILERGLFVVVSGYVNSLKSVPCCTVVALDLKTEEEPMESLLMELEAMRYYKSFYYPKLFHVAKERGGTVDSTVATLDEILNVIRKNHGMSLGALQQAFDRYSQEQLEFFLSKLVDDFSIYMHDDIYFPL